MFRATPACRERYQDDIGGKAAIRQFQPLQPKHTTERLLAS
jgi:hypothetical protein